MKNSIFGRLLELNAYNLSFNSRAGSAVIRIFRITREASTDNQKEMKFKKPKTSYSNVKLLCFDSTARYFLESLRFLQLFKEEKSLFYFVEKHMEIN